MPSCLGIYVDGNLIKYAKMSKESDNVKVEACGTKIYEEDIEKAVGQIIKETYSYSNVQISLNLENVKYTYTKLFNLLNKNDFAKAINTEFEYFCTDNGKNKNALEYRTTEINDLEDEDKKRVIYAYTEKTNIVQRAQIANGYKINKIVPLGMTINNLSNFINNENSIIVNIENKTEVTTLVNGFVYKVDTIDLGMQDVIEKIAQKENSYNKAYEICKNTTIYTNASQNLQVEENEYLEEIVTTVINIIQKVKEVVNQNGIDVSNIYLTGLGVTINNIDLLFQENFMQSKCEIIIPYFVEKTNLKINIKDYIEVNSAISLALQGLGIGNKNINFGKEKISFSELLKSDVSRKPKTIKTKEKIPFKEKLKHDINANADKYESILLRILSFVAIMVIVYGGYSKILEKDIKQNIEKTKRIIEDTDTKIVAVQDYSKKVDDRTSQYQNIIEKIEANNEKNNDLIASKNAIPNLLHEIMFAIPKEVQILSIKNTGGKEITIEAESEDYSQLGYFKAKLSQQGALNNITISSGQKESGVIKVTIKGQLPY